MLSLQGVHHIAIICADYEKSKHFYTTVLGLQLVRELYRAERQSYKADLALNGAYIIELFSFPDPPRRLSRPEGTGLRHLAFAVTNVDDCIGKLAAFGITAEPVRIDETTGKRFTFFADPDELPIELYEQ